MAKPDRLLIPFVDFDERFELVGRDPRGNQFIAFVTGAFPADWGSGKYSPEYMRIWWPDHKRWYAVLHRFAPDGAHLGTEVRLGGTSAREDEAVVRADKELAAMLASVTPFELRDIQVKLFGVEIDGYFFGLIYDCWNDDPPGTEGDNEYVMLQPNDIMFHPPWGSGEYST